MDTFFCKTSPKGVIRATGEDAEDYLQSQWSINLRKLKIGGVRYGLRLSTKGKVMADAYFLRLDEEEFLLISKECEANDLLLLLKENIVADEIEFINESENWKLLTFWTNDKTTSPIIYPLEKPEKNAFLKIKSEFIFEDLRVATNTFCVLTPKAEENNPSSKAKESDFKSLEQRRIKAGLASVPHEIGANDLPQEGRMELVAVDFDKGCYLGQEVMARIHAMGKVRRLVYPISWDGSQCPTLPATLFANGKKVGFVKSLFQITEKEWYGMAIIHENGISTFENEGLQMEEIGEARIKKL